MGGEHPFLLTRHPLNCSALSLVSFPFTFPPQFPYFNAGHCLPRYLSGQNPFPVARTLPFLRPDFSVHSLLVRLLSRCISAGPLPCFATSCQGVFLYRTKRFPYPLSLYPCFCSTAPLSVPPFLRCTLLAEATRNPFFPHTLSSFSGHLLARELTAPARLTLRFPKFPENLRLHIAFPPSSSPATFFPTTKNELSSAQSAIAPKRFFPPSSFRPPFRRTPPFVTETW